MNNDELRDELKTLHDEIEQAIHKEPLDKDMFGQIMTRLVEVAQGGELPEEEGESLKEQLEDQATDFEANHPRLAGILRDVMDVLAKLGI